MKYKSVIVTRRGGTEVLKIIENDLHAPSSGEVRIKILATPVCQDDIAARVGNRPFLPRIPFVPGYSILGIADAIGEGVTNVAVGDRVAALTRLGGHAEYILLPEEKLVHVPETLDPAEAVILILNYTVAYQVLHRYARVKPDDKVLIIGASGGVGTAFLQLGKLANLKMYGLASSGKHGTLTELGAIPIDYHTQDFVEVIRQMEPDGVDFVFNGMREEYIARGLAVLRRGGAMVQYGGPQSFSRFLLLLAKFALFNLLPNGKAIKGYGTHRVDINLPKEDWLVLFKLLEKGKIKPVIAERFPILEAPKANKLLESGKVTGNIVLLAPELL
ncbi:TPA: zinc-binding dehydrogenase [Methanosarcina acetivorans]|nr:medium chain dehydrogenase/reductase family protein [Methanosarcina acetivorans]HIH95553.1 zinc-binding dehydrogenase [Methanosarcina acetivorans]